MNTKIRAGGLVVLLGCILLPFLSSHAEGKLIARWTFNESTEDVSGNGHSLTLQNGATYSTVSAEGSHSLLLGKTAYASAGSIDLGETFSITSWTLLNPEQTNIQTIIGNCEGGSRIDGFKLFVNNWETSNKCVIVEASDGVDRTDVTSPENTFEEGFWNHVAMTADLSERVVCIYYNGELVSDPSLVVPIFQTIQPIVIGGMPPGAVYNWQGMIDDVAIYEGVLSEDEIVDLMNAPSQVKAGDDDHLRSPQSIVLDQNYPNPFNPSTTISYSLTDDNYVRLQVYDVNGKLIANLVDELQESGSHHIPFHADFLPSGVYLCRLEAGVYSAMIKMVRVD